MKAIILAAGRGTRLNKYTDALPKGMLNFHQKSLIERQIDTLRANGIEDITIVTGYMAEKISFEGVKNRHNPDYATTNMLESLFCAADVLEGEVLIGYADIIYENKIVQALQQASASQKVTVAVDSHWQHYWKARYGKVDFDLESLSLHPDGTIKELGNEEVTVEEIDARYIGLIKFSKEGTELLKKIYYENKSLYWDKPWQKSGKTFQNAYMTDMLQAFIDEEYQVYTASVENGWLEFDTNEDYERMMKLLETDELKSLYKFDN